MRAIANAFWLGRKELRSVVRDTALALFIVYAFTVDIYNVASGVETGVRDASVAIVDGDRSVLSRRIADALLPPYFRPAAQIDRSEIDAAMDRGRYTFVLDIPPAFEADLLRGRSPSIQLLIDATAMTQAGIGAGYVDAIARREIADYLAARGGGAAAPAATVTRALFNPNLEGRRFQAVMAVVEHITIVAVLLTGAAVMREREHGTVEHLLSMPLGAVEIAAAKIWANGAIVLLAATVSLHLVVGGALDVPIRGTTSLFVAGAAVYLFAVCALGVCLATLANSMPQFALLAIPVFLVVNMLSGATSPLSAMPAPLQAVLQASPAVHFVSFAQGVLFRGAGIETVWRDLAALGVLGSAFLALALARFRSMLARQR